MNVDESNINDDIINNSNGNNKSNNEGIFISSNNQYKLIDHVINTSSNNKYIVLLFFILSLYSLSDGAEMVVISLILTKLQQEWSITETEKGVIGSSILIGIVIGTFIGGMLSDSKGRKITMIKGGFLVSLFSMLSAFSTNYIVFVCFRFLYGLGMGISIPSSSSLLAELTPEKKRLLVLSIVWLFYPVGESFIIIIYRIFSEWDNGWRIMLFTAAFPSILVFILSFFIIESPRFYYTMGSFDECVKVLDLFLISQGKKCLRAEDIERLVFEGNEEKRGVIDSKIELSSVSATDKLDKLENSVVCDDVDIMSNIENKKDLNQKDIINNISFIEENKINDNSDLKESKNNEYVMCNDNIKSHESNKKRINSVTVKGDTIDFSNSNISNTNYNVKEYSAYSPKIDSLISHSKINKRNNKKKIFSFNFGFIELLSGDYLILSIKLMIMFFCLLYIYGGIIYILPQTLEKIQNNNIADYHKKNDTLKLNYTANSGISDTDANSSDFNEDNNTIFINLLISALSEVPSNLISVIMANSVLLGRKMSMCYGFLFSGIFSITSILWIKYLAYSASLLKLSICIPFNIIFIYINEAYPTKIRSKAIGVNFGFARFAGVSTPLVIQKLFSLNLVLPYISFLIVSVLGVIASFLLPYDTLGREIKNF